MSIYICLTDRPNDQVSQPRKSSFSLYHFNTRTDRKFDLYSSFVTRAYLENFINYIFITLIEVKLTKITLQHNIRCFITVSLYKLSFFFKSAKYLQIYNGCMKFRCRLKNVLIYSYKNASIHGQHLI